jgi:hypothetical protein
MAFGGLWLGVLQVMEPVPALFSAVDSQIVSSKYLPQRPNGIGGK